MLFLSVAGFGVAGLGGLASVAIVALIQHLPGITPPSAAGQTPLAWSLAASALLVWALGAVVRPQ